MKSRRTSSPYDVIVGGDGKKERCFSSPLDFSAESCVKKRKDKFAWSRVYIWGPSLLWLFLLIPGVQSESFILLSDSLPGVINNHFVGSLSFQHWMTVSKKRRDIHRKSMAFVFYRRLVFTDSLDFPLFPRFLMRMSLFSWRQIQNDFSSQKQWEHHILLFWLIDSLPFFYGRSTSFFMLFFRIIWFPRVVFSALLSPCFIFHSFSLIFTCLFCLLVLCHLFSISYSCEVRMLFSRSIEIP